MPDSALVNVLANGGVAGIVIVLILVGLLVPKWVHDDLKAERDALKQALAEERDRADAAVAAAQASRDLIAALQTGMQMAAREHPPPGGQGP